MSGMLLYAKTDEAILPQKSYRMGGNTIMVKTLDLDCDFEVIKHLLNTVVEDYF